MEVVDDGVLLASFLISSRLLKNIQIDKKLDITFETFRDKLYPGQEEEWKIKITGKETEFIFKSYIELVR